MVSEPENLDVSKDDDSLIKAIRQGVKPHWEKGYRSHGYWIDIHRIGCVSLGPPRLSRMEDGYGVEFEPYLKDYVKTQAKTLREGKKIVEAEYKKWLERNNLD
jgi:hypothetical protein